MTESHGREEEKGETNKGYGGGECKGRHKSFKMEGAQNTVDLFYSNK